MHQLIPGGEVCWELQDKLEDVQVCFYIDALLLTRTGFCVGGLSAIGGGGNVIGGGVKCGRTSYYQESLMREYRR